MREIKVRLTADLTKYLSGLVAGLEGITVGQLGRWSKNDDRFVSVNFPGKGTLDVLWESLEIIDEEYLAEAEKRKQKELEELKTAYDVVKYVGPRGGFKYLSYQYTNSDGVNVGVTQGFKKKAEKLIAIFESYGIEVVEKVIG
ncbi:hypothetical protein CW697_04625 [Macrococcoides caseolyticum]|uniref:hypothetical protein n=1 Tax=Macrococcoides caseolyticum TaxID=69966 RepID=UPI000C336E47|nr:hypothetical protein [Macrococcus caseolyticus]PKE34599.1 hypothetical protein CW668_01865 [Macrococcus caseolyticus]PKF30134.1 hypothetical protein CW697_04625 [Macrococcus caseolyticus]STY78273.1 Uncharacterised protein [Macrococcus caseolyticus]